MKKLAFTVICASALIYFSSCSETNKSQPEQEKIVRTSIVNQEDDTLKEIKLITSLDTLHNAMGINYFEWSGINNFVKQPQRKLIIDTVRVYSTYVYKVNTTSNKKEKEQLIAEMRYKIDSICGENAKRIALFSKGIKDVLATSDDKQDAYDLGISIGVGIKADILAIYAKEILGSEEAAETIDKDIFITALCAAINGKKEGADEARELVAKTKEQIRD